MNNIQNRQSLPNAKQIAIYRNQIRQDYLFFSHLEYLFWASIVYFLIFSIVSYLVRLCNLPSWSSFLGKNKVGRPTSAPLTPHS